MSLLCKHACAAAAEQNWRFACVGCFRILVFNAWGPAKSMKRRPLPQIRKTVQKHGIPRRPDNEGICALPFWNAIRNAAHPNSLHWNSPSPAPHLHFLRHNASTLSLLGWRAYFRRIAQVPEDILGNVRQFSASGDGIRVCGKDVLKTDSERLALDGCSAQFVGCFLAAPC